MNKKFSTLLTAGLLVVGSLFSSTFAETIKRADSPATKVEDKQYLLVQKGTSTQYALGMTGWSEENQEVTFGYKDVASGTATVDDASAYLWKVSESNMSMTGDKWAVKFTNVKTGKTLNVKKDGSALEPVYTEAALNNADNRWFWGGYKKYAKAVEDGTATTLHAAYADEAGTYQVLYITSSGTDHFQMISSGSGACSFELYEVANQSATDDELNALYNGSGFNFKLADENIANIFAEQRVYALDLSSAETVDGADYTFPAGTYFLTEVGDGASLVDLLLNSTFIVASPTENVSANADLQKAGQGFTLTTVSGRDLNTYTVTNLDQVVASKKTSGSEVSVYNACFTVTKNVTNAGKYALSLAKFRYQKAANDAAHDQKSVSINTKAVYYGSSKYLCTDAAGTNFVFTLAAANVVEAKDILKVNAPAIYNIRFVSGDNDETELGKYLSAAYTSTTTTALYAKGEVLADLETPAFQFIVTAVSGNKITFTNRETGANFETQLFDEENGIYSLDAAGSFTILNVDNAGDVVSGDTEALADCFIQLIPVEERDIYAGFLNVDDKTKVTLAFARDETPTSNKLYPSLVYNETASAYELDDEMVDNVAYAAQWQLVKSQKPTLVKRSYVYLNDSEKQVIKNLGDTVAYYTYHLQIVFDGAEQNLYLDRDGSNGTKLSAYTTIHTPQSYVIKENVDGSVYLLNQINGTKYISVEEYNDNELKNYDREVQYQTIAQTSKATDLNTYLLGEAAEVSLPAEASYVALKSEVGNYISMNEEYDGVLAATAPETLRVIATDLTNVVPSFYITEGWDEETGARAFLFNPADSVKYYAAAGVYDREYQWAEGKNKAIFKPAVLNETADTLTTAIKGNLVEVANKANNQGVKGGLNYFKTQIVLANPLEEDLYIIRQGGSYLTAINNKLAWTDNRAEALKVYAETMTSPTANEAVAAAEVSVVAVNGAIIVKGAAGKVVTVANILGQTIANQVAASDNVTIAAPAGIAVVTVDGEATKVVVK